MRQQRISVRTRRSASIEEPLDLRTPTGTRLPY
jgi:hypothetical protein